MVEAILKLFVSDQQAESTLSNPVAELIFMVLFFTFILAIIVHLILYTRLRKVRNFISIMNSLDIPPVKEIQAEFEQKKQQDSIKVETFVQKKFSEWRVLNIPVVSLIKMIQMTISLFILIGVLGTFIGLAMSLGSINALGGDQLVENVAFVLAGIDVAFYTSIAGMGLSLIMTVVTKVANTEYILTDIMLKTESLLDEKEQDPLSRLIEVSETINTSINQLRETNQESLQSIVTSFAGFQEYTVGLQQSAKDLAKFNEGLSQNLKDFTVIFNSMNELTAGFDQGVKKLNHHFDQLFTYFQNMDERNERMMTTFSETYQRINDLTVSQTESMNTFQHSIVNLKEYFSSIAKRQESIQSTFAKINTQTDHFVKLMEENNYKFERIFGDDLNTTLLEMNTYLRELRNDFHTLGNSISRLPNAFETVNKAQTDYKNLLNNRFDELKQYNLEFSNHLQAYSTNSQAFEKYLSDASRTSEQASMKNSQLLNEINRTITQMSDSFSHKEGQIEASVNALKETLSRYVMNFEGTIGDKLEKVSRNIGDYTVEMNETVKKEFKQITEITADNGERSTRYLKTSLNELTQEFQQLNRQLQALSQDSARQRDTVRIGNND